jgi:CRISPR/Cas system CSM-associated protein Csm3 (group 7 of RAMP superfamily)
MKFDNEKLQYRETDILEQILYEKNAICRVVDVYTEAAPRSRESIPRGLEAKSRIYMNYNSETYTTKQLSFFGLKNLSPIDQSI